MKMLRGGHTTSASPSPAPAQLPVVSTYSSTHFFSYTLKPHRPTGRQLSYRQSQAHSQHGPVRPFVIAPGFPVRSGPRSGVQCECPGPATRDRCHAALLLLLLGSTKAQRGTAQGALTAGDSRGAPAQESGLGNAASMSRGSREVTPRPSQGGGPGSPHSVLPELVLSSLPCPGPFRMP